MSDPDPWFDVGGSARPLRLVLALAVGLAAALATSPRVVLTTVPIDSFVPLNGAWAMFQGLAIHRDYHTPVGMLYDASHALMLHLSADARILLWAPVLWAAVIGAIFVGTVYRRLPPIVGAVLLMTTLVVAMTPLKLDADHIDEFAHLALYNRVGWALLIPVVVLPFTPGPPLRVREGLLTGSALLILFYVKITYFALGGAALLVGLWHPATRRWALLTGSATLATTLATLGLFEGSQAYLTDLAQAAAAQSGPDAASDGGALVNPRALLHEVIANGRWLTLIAVGSAVLARQPPRRHALPIVGAPVLLALLCLVVGRQSHDAFIPLLMGVGCLPILALREAGAAAAARTLGWGWLLATGAFLALHGGAVFRHRAVAANPEPLVPFVATSGPLSPLMVPPKPPDAPSPRALLLSGRLSASQLEGRWAGQSSADLAASMRAGHAAATRAVQAGATRSPLVPLMANPFPMALGAIPARGELSWYHDGRTFSADAPPDIARMISTSDVVLIPRVNTNNFLLRQEFMIDALTEATQGWSPAHTPDWLVFLRPGLLPAAPGATLEGTR